MDAAALPPLPDLERWLADREARVTGLKPGVEAGVVWARQARVRTPLSLVYLHGYTATRGELFPVPDLVAAALGANLFYARLTGHGAGPTGHRDVTVEDWERDGLEALAIGRALGEKVIVLATSTGATLLAWLALGPARVPADAAILVSPNLTPRNRQSELLLWPGHQWLVKRMVGTMMTIPAQNALHSRFWDLIHHSHSLIPMMRLVARARRLNFRTWSWPVMVVYDPGDTVVDELVTEKLFSRGPETLVTLSPWKTIPGDDNHVLAGDALSPGGTERMVELCLGFLKRVLSV